MRLPLLSPASLSPEQQKLSEDMRQGIESNFKGFQAINSEGALIGPLEPLAAVLEVRRPDLGARRFRSRCFAPAPRCAHSPVRAQRPSEGRVEASAARP